MTINQELHGLRIYAIHTPAEMRAVLRLRSHHQHNQRVAAVRKRPTKLERLAAKCDQLDYELMQRHGQRIAALESRLAEPTPAPQPQGDDAATGPTLEVETGPGSGVFEPWKRELTDTPAPQPQGYSLSEAVRKAGYPTQITNPHDLDPGAWARGSAAAGAQPVSVDEQPQGDDAAVRALTAVIGWGSACDPSLAGHAARMVLQEIRCGKVPGVFISGLSLAGQDRSRILKELNAANIDEGIAAIVELRAQLAEAETSRDSYHKAACNHKAREEDCWRERDRLAAQVAELTRKRDARLSGWTEAASLRHKLHEKQDTLDSVMALKAKSDIERDAARADAERLRGLLLRLRSNHPEASVPSLGVRQMLSGEQTAALWREADAALEVKP